MYNLFGTKWCNIFAGPLWSYAPVAQANEILFGITLRLFYRSLNNILGFSKETLVALTTNIEGREWHRREVVNGNCKADHPRASTTDDVECFFSMIRDNIEHNFTTKQVNLMPAKSMWSVLILTFPFIIVLLPTLDTMRDPCHSLTYHLWSHQPRRKLLEENNLWLLRPDVLPCLSGEVCQ